MAKSPAVKTAFKDALFGGKTKKTGSGTTGAGSAKKT